MSDNIFALSTPDLPSAICIFRLSGPDVLDITNQLLKKPLPQENKIYFRSFYTPNKQDIIDHGVVFFKRAPHSYTGDNMVEIQLHGSRAVIRKMHDILVHISNLRQAEKGEFTKRAFLNNKTDILQAEALGDLIHATTDYQRRMALEGMEGHFSNFIEAIRQAIFKLMSLTSALIDFADDEVPESVASEIHSLLQENKNKLSGFLNNARTIDEVKNGLKVAIMGAPNAGKSSLINAILDKDAVIVSDQEGTTRDTLIFNLDIKGYPIRFYDTAGLRETQDPIEKEGIKRALQTAQETDLILFLQDPSKILSPFYAQLPQEKIIPIYTKSDQHNINPSYFAHYFKVSAHQKKNLDYIMSYLALYFRHHFDQRNCFSLSQERYRIALQDILYSFEKALFMETEEDFFLLSEELRIALGHIEELTCKINFEDVLGDIFSSFCIGK